MMLFTRLFNYFIPEEVQNNTVANTKARIFVGSGLPICLVFLANAHRGFTTVDTIQGVVMLVGALFLFSTFWILKLLRSTTIACNTFLAIAFSLLLMIVSRTAGPNSMTQLNFAILVIIGFLICGFRSGLTWGAISLLQLGVLKFMAASGFEFTPVLLDGIFPSILVLFIVILILSAVYERSSSSSWKNFVLEREKSEKINKTLEIMLDEIRTVMAGVSKGDLSKRIEMDTAGNVAILKDSVNNALDMLGQTIAKVISVSGEINNRTFQVSNSIQSLASGTTEQAASIEEISSSMEDIQSKAISNNEKAQQAQELSNQTSNMIENITQEMNAMQGSMTRINQSSTDVSKVIKVIEEIAFQNKPVSP